jgi:hypothetical protein
VALRLTDRIEQLSRRSEHDVIGTEDHQHSNGANRSTHTDAQGGTPHGHFAS